MDDSDVSNKSGEVRPRELVLDCAKKSQYRDAKGILNSLSTAFLNSLCNKSYRSNHVSEV